MDICIQFYKSPAGELILGSHDDKLCLCDWRYRKMRKTIDRRIQDTLGLPYREGESDVNHAAQTELEDYFRGERTVFSIPLLTAGTDFQNLVWEELQNIPYGETSGYGELAERLNRPEAVRAVAAASGANALSIFIPCHRVIGSSGGLTGYAGGLKAKELLLNIEKGEPEQYSLFI